MRAKLSNPNYFGPGGTVAPETLSYSTLSTINATTLAACDIFLGGGSGDISSTEAAAVGTWLASDPDHFVVGGCDNTSQQTCQIFGRPNQNGASGGGIALVQALSYNPITCGGVTGVDTYGGAATAYTVQPTDTVLATFVSGPFAGRPGAFTDDPINPTFLVTADPDMFLTGGGSTMTSGPIASDDQDVFVLNVFKFVLDGIQGRLANPACPADYNSRTDIEVALSASSNSVVVGTMVTLFAQVANTSGTGVDDVVASVPVPPGFTHVSDNGGGDYNSATGAWDIGSLSGLSSETLEIVIRADTVSTPTATLESISQSLPDLNSAPNATFGVDDLGDGLNDDDEATLALSITEPADRSDAPLSGAAPDGSGAISYGEATHVVRNGIRLGAVIDADSGSLANSDATGDGADDDGVTFPSLPQGQSVTIQVSVTQASGNDGYLQGWIDWNGDGDFADADEQIAIDLQSASPGPSTISVPVSVPGTAASATFARFRWSTTAGLDATTAAPDGEVEDYRVIIEQADLALFKSMAPAAPVDGDVVTFTLVVTNEGVSQVTGIEVTDLLPAGIAFDSASGAGTYDDTTGLWTVGDLAAGATARLDIVTTVSGTAAITNQAQITAADQGDVDSVPFDGTNNGFGEDDRADGLADDDEAEITFTPLAADIEITGTVFFDDGTGTGATAHDGLLQGDEAGAGGGAVEAIDAGGNVVASTTTDGTGNYTLAVPAALDGTGVTVRAVLPNGAVHISGAVTGATDADTTDGEVPVTLAAGTGYVFDFGLAKAPRLTEDQVKPVAPGGAVLVSHTFTAGGPVDATFSVANESQSPAGAFTTALFYDEDCSGTVDPADTSVAGSRSFAAGEVVCLLARASAVSAARTGASVTFDIEANVAYSGTAITAALINTDRVTVTEANSLVLSKQVCNANATTCDVATGAGFGTNNSGLPGDTLVYRIIFSAPGPDPIDAVAVYDRTPQFSALTSTAPSIVTQPAGLTCALVVPATPAAGYTGELEWSCPGTMIAGEQGVVSFEVEVAR